VLVDISAQPFAEEVLQSSSARSATSRTTAALPTGLVYFQVCKFFVAETEATSQHDLPLSLLAFLSLCL
jgi:hypothetical protein